MLSDILVSVAGAIGSPFFMMGVCGGGSLRLEKARAFDQRAHFEGNS
jgi:hypothetical protein